ncbi:hypothetical protein G6F32_015030 [Rhizopus arrhizus]|nr:hypothetical protein G6F32_015030 [Rhizopus arrhizus]
MSPWPSRVSAPDWSRMVRESILELTWKAMRVGMLALIRPVITSTDGRCVARIRWMPAARAFCARRAISSSTFLPTIIIMSANSSMKMTMNGSVSSGRGASPSSGFGLNSGSINGWPASCASFTFLLKPARLRTPTALISL